MYAHNLINLAVSVQDNGEKWIKHYSSSHKILLVGEGDFSFAACLAIAFGSANNMVATSLDSKGLLMEKHPTAGPNLKELEDRGCTIVHDVDAHTMSQHPLLTNKLFDRIVFNFPHAGFDFREHDILQIIQHQKVVKAFLRSARDMLAENGEAHVTHKTTHPFTQWHIEELAEEVGLRLVEKVEFRTLDYPGYINKRGARPRSDRTFLVGECSTFKFGVKNGSGKPEDRTGPINSQKIVMKVQLNSDKCRSKAMKLVRLVFFFMRSVSSVEIQGADKDELVVIGERVDSVGLTNLLRKKVGYAAIVKVEEMKAKEEPKKEVEVNPTPICYTVPSIVYYEPNQSGCSIM
ncbi:hypothetical protein L1049_000738 [Liquidambar formosana]|uniref:25S rRNA (uridine-N(3))-methyltransferase BMT5-like domain-containing protein n=1 Tax=Liquidambar formosana TaxID=63359 RepID=A0AAP0NBI5_LIQFO